MDRPSPVFTRDISIFSEALQRGDLFISYHALPDEIAIEKIPFLTEILEQKPLVLIPITKMIDPFYFACEVIRKYSKKQGIIFIPGQKFDPYGTRHGRGGGWYDRFLSHVPKTWIRIGVTDQKHLSENELLCKPWDEPMDWILCRDAKSWHVCETKARDTRP